MGKGPDAAVIDYSEPGSIEGRLIGFDVGSAALDSVHRSWLNNHVVPVLTAGGALGLTGLTSRSGSDAVNLKLSQQRVNAVIDYLRKNVSRPFPVGFAVGVGETQAAQAGQKQGSEHPFYRAVIVLAWYKPTPTPPKPKPKVEAQRKKRVTSRMWNKFSSRMQGEPGEIGMEIGDLTSDIIDGISKGGSDERTYAMIPADHVVTHVYDDFTVVDDLGIGVNTTTYKRTITYEWGPPTSEVFLRKRQKLIQNGNDYGWETKKRYYSRREIWKHTSGPDASVVW